jgi:hypothetical protein
VSSTYFYKEMKSYLEEYIKFLRKSIPSKVVDQHYDIIFFYIEFLHHKEMCIGFEEISIAMCNSKFRPYFIKNTNKLLSEKNCRMTLKGFFDFIYDRHGIKNEKVMKALSKK